MKKFLLLTFIGLALFSCSDDLQFNEHAFQVVKDNEPWRATEFKANVNEDGYVSIIGILNNETVTLYLESMSPGTYALGNSANSSAWFNDSEGIGYTTEYRGDGEVTIDKYDPASQSFTGSFRFNAVSGDGVMVNFTKGIFYQVPIVYEDEEDDKDSKLQAMVDDILLDAEEIVVQKNNSMIEVRGKAADGSFIKIMVPETILEGSYNLNQQSDHNTNAIYGYANGETSNSQYGTLFVTQHDALGKMIKGSFTFTTLLPNRVSIDNGSFTIYY